jgi:chemotaxis methyl-accepting protein methylase
VRRPAQPESARSDEQELIELKQAIRQKCGFECDAYKEPCLRRRLAVRLRARGLHSYAAYRRLIEQDATEAERLIDAITINVSKFFRNQEVWQALRVHVLPGLFKRLTRVRIWSAGCASGEEPYTLAMLLSQYAEQHGMQSALRRFDLLGTDVDAQALERAAQARFGDFSFSEIDPALRAQFFEGNRLRDEIKRLVRFQEHDLMTGSVPQRQHLILCRNVIIYFQRDVQERLFRQFHGALEREGVLVLGKVETMFGTSAQLFRPLVNRERIFCRA